MLNREHNDKAVLLEVCFVIIDLVRIISVRSELVEEPRLYKLGMNKTFV
jgi:hypothetical protein